MTSFSSRLSVLTVTTFACLVLLAQTSLADEAEAPVSAGNYKAALEWLASQLQAVEAQEQKKQLIVWLFDESNSMKDDQHEIRKLLPQFYAGLNDGTDTVVVSFSSSPHVMTREPVSDIKEIASAIDRIPIEQSRPEENLCQAIGKSAETFSRLAQDRKQQAIIVVVTDESPSDSGDASDKDYGLIEKTIAVCRRTRTPVFVLGPEAVFGNYYAQLRWVDPVYGLKHWIRISRGPETANPERLLWNGLGQATDGILSGFGAYSHERLCRETGGGFFLAVQTPDEVQRRRRAMIGYEPDWSSRRDYEQSVGKSKFRVTCREVIQTLNASTDTKLNLRQRHFSVELAEFQKQGAGEFQKAAYALALTGKAIERLDAIRNLRDEEPSKRWQANYDLLYAQCLTFQARLPQYLLALDQHASESPRPGDVKHNRWMLQLRPVQPLDPTAAQFQRLERALKLDETRGKYIDRVDSERQVATDSLNQIEADHPGTPWSAVARLERIRGFGVEVKSYFHDPKYQEVGKRIKVPVF